MLQILIFDVASPKDHNTNAQGRPLRLSQGWGQIRKIFDLLIIFQTTIRSEDGVGASNNANILHKLKSQRRQV